MGDDSESTPAPAADVDVAPTLLSHAGEDHGEEDAADSIYGGSIAGSDTTSLRSSVLRYREENGRTYHSYGSTEHWGPNDEAAQDQQDLSHHLWCLAMKGALYLAPAQNALSILDLGAGTGIWVIEVAEQHPEAKVTGIDVSPIQPQWVPPNAFFEIDDYNLDWLDDEKHDLIHARELLGTVPDWVALYNKAYKALKPGGWFEQHEPSLHFRSDVHPFEEDSPYKQWDDIMVPAGEKAGLSFGVGENIKSRMEEAGFINVVEWRQPWLVGGWSKDKHQREVGQWNQLRLELGIPDFCTRRMANQLGYSKQEIEVYVARIRAVIRNSKLYVYQWAWHVYGQKPESES